MNRENPQKLGTACPYGVPGMTSADEADTPEARLKVALAVKAARYLMGERVKTPKQEKAGPMPTSRLAELTANTRNELARDRIEGIEQIARDKNGKLPVAARPWELTAILEAVGGRDAILAALEPLIGEVAADQNSGMLVLRLDASGVEALVAVLSGTAGPGQIDATDATRTLAQALQEASQARLQPTAVRPRTSDALDRPGPTPGGDA